MLINRFAQRFLKDDRGSATVEAVLWLPMFFMFFMMVADVSMVFHRQTQMLRVVQDANRSLSTGRLATEAATEAYIENTLSKMSSGVQATTTIQLGVITSTVLVPVRDMVAVGVFKFLSGYNVSVKSQQFVEF